MKNSNEVRLGLEVLEDRLALNGAFGGAINAAPPSLVPFPFNGLVLQPTVANLTENGFRNSFANIPQMTFVPAPSMQSQLQSFQADLAAQTAMMDQFFMQSVAMLQWWNLSNSSNFVF